jgi:hypothetical protein
MTDEENEDAYDAVIKFIDNMLKPPNRIEYYYVENTGWSNGRSWFSCGTDTNPYRANSVEEAIEYIKRNRWDDPLVKWRYVHVMIEREDNRTITTETWTEV